MPSFLIRPWRPESDDIEALTSMLHRAYAPLAAAGMNFTACDQAPEVTLRRLSGGHALVAECGGALVGTLTIYPPEANALDQEEQDEAVFAFGQFGVDPAFKGQGIGRALHREALDYAASLDGRFMELDTAAPAADLIATYQRWGYRFVSYAKYPGRFYDSVIMRRGIGLPELQ